MASTFEHYRRRLEPYRLVESGTISDDDLVGAIRRIDDGVAAQEGRGFNPTPLAAHAELAAAIGLHPTTELWVKDETGNVSGSHKARHLFGVALDHALRSDGHDDGADGPFAIASCGNAALGAAVVARAVDHELDVFVPTWANDAVVERIETLGGHVVRSERLPGVLGDPAHHAMVAAIDQGAIPFSCQGSETPAAIDGARTIAYEIVDALLAGDGAPTTRIDRMFVQVGGGALGSAVASGLAAAPELVELPTFHVVQPEGNHPLVRAWDRLVAELLDEAAPGSNADRFDAATRLGAADDELARTVMRRVSTTPDRYMTAWETEPVSYATGILDDVTYDWLPLIDVTVRTGGFPIVAAEDDLVQAHRLAHQCTDIPVCPTGSAGLGGLIALLRDAPASLEPGERIVVLFTGHMRPGDPDP